MESRDSVARWSVEIPLQWGCDVSARVDRHIRWILLAYSKPGTGGSPQIPTSGI